MPPRRRDASTLDLFRDYSSPAAVERFDEQDVQAWSLAGKVSRAVGLAMDESGMSRAEIADQMSEYLGERISKATLDAYASQGKETHQISAARLVALVAVTKDFRLVNALFERVNLIAVPKKYEALIRRELAAEMRDRAAREADAADAEWKAKR